MKKILLSALLLSSVFGLFSCSEDFEVAAPYKNITIIYGLLNKADTAHYIRIQKAFLDEKKSAIDMAKVADSSFYKEGELDVSIKELVNNVVINTIPLTRVDLNLEGYTKDSGTFFQSPNYAYKFKKQLNANNSYRLLVVNKITGLSDSSEIRIIDSTDFTIFSTLAKLAFSRTTPPNATASTYRIDLEVKNNVRYIEGMIRFHWVNLDQSTQIQTDDSADFIFSSKAVEKSFENLITPNLAFFSFLKSAMGAAPPGVVRYLDSADIFVYAGGRDFADYIRINQIQSGGLTGDQIKPLYTNIKGSDVYGLFSTRAYKTKLEVPIDEVTIDSLKVNSITSDLRIIGVSDH